MVAQSPAPKHTQKISVHPNRKHSRPARYFSMVIFLVISCLAEHVVTWAQHGKPFTGERRPLQPSCPVISFRKWVVRIYCVTVFPSPPFYSKVQQSRLFVSQNQFSRCIAFMDCSEDFMKFAKTGMYQLNQSMPRDAFYWGRTKGTVVECWQRRGRRVISP